MSQNPYSQSPPPPQQQPPQMPYPQTPTGYYVPQPKRSVWPTVIGVISIILAAMGLLCGPVMTVINAYNPATQKVYEFLPDWYRTWEIGSMFVGIVFSTILLIGGILLLKRRPAGRTLHLLCAALSILIAMVNGLVLASVIGNTAGMPGPMRLGMIGGALGGSCGGLIYPVFLLIWFLRGAIRQEVDGWPIQDEASRPQ